MISIERFSKVETAETQRQNQKLDFVFVPDENLPTFKFDFSGISSVVSHLLNLSMMACRNGDQPEINLQVDLQQRHAVIALTDNGDRINVSESREVLDPFGFGDDQKIYGIGLAVSRKIIAGHDGELLISHPSHAGNRFEIYLPLVG